MVRSDLAVAGKYTIDHPWMVWIQSFCSPNSHTYIHNMHNIHLSLSLSLSLSLPLSIHILYIYIYIYIAKMLQLLYPIFPSSSREQIFVAVGKTWGLHVYLQHWSTNIPRRRASLKFYGSQWRLEYPNTWILVSSTFNHDPKYICIHMYTYININYIYIYMHAIYAYIYIYIIHIQAWRFPKIGVHLNHPFFCRISMKSTIQLLGYPHFRRNLHM